MLSCVARADVMVFVAPLCLTHGALLGCIQPPGDSSDLLVLFWHTVPW